MDELGDGKLNMPRAGRRARQTQMMLMNGGEEQVVAGDEAPQGSTTETTAFNVASSQNSGRINEEAEQEEPSPSNLQKSASSRRQGFNAEEAPADPLADIGSGKKFVGVSRRKQEQELQAKEEQQKAKGKYDERAGPELMDIPELEEEGKEDLSRVVAAAPKVRANKIQGMSELEDQALNQLPTQADTDINLSILTSVLLPSHMVYESDEVWNHALLLSQVAAEINADKEKGMEKPSESMSGINDLMMMTSGL